MIYFLKGEENGYVKIGWSKTERTLNRRVYMLQSGHPVKLNIIRLVEAPRWVEAWFHGFFAGLRIAGEWFAYRADMLTVEPPSVNPKREAEPPRQTAKNPITLALLEARHAAQITQSELAQLLGLSASFMCEIENGRAPLPRKHYGALPEPIRRAVIDAAIAERSAEIAELEALR